jgi:hypothetical protein
MCYVILSITLQIINVREDDTLWLAVSRYTSTDELTDNRMYITSKIVILS